MNWYNDRGDYYVLIIDIRTGEIVGEKKVVRNALFFEDEEAIRYGNKVKEVMTENNDIYRVKSGNILEKFKKFKKGDGFYWSNGNKYSQYYTLVDKTNVEYFKGKLKNAILEKDYYQGGYTNGSNS